MCISGDLVGIGTAAPSVQLDVSGPGVQKIQVSGQDAAVNILDQRNATPFVLYQNSLNYGVFSSNALPFWLYQNNGLRMVISNGNVGIGTTAPGASLDLSGGVARVQRIYNGLANAFVIADSTAGSPVARWGVGILNAGTGSGNGGHDFAINAYDDAANILSSALTIKRSNGNVGIGTTAPAERLDVSGNAQVALGGAGYAQLTVGSSTSGVYIQGNRSNATSYIRSPGAGLYLGGGSGGDSTMLILNQRVAINQSDTTYALGVTAGSASAAAINMSTWPRYGTVSNCYFGTYSSINGNGVVWTTSNAISTDIMTVAANRGTYFVVKKGGIYSINASFTGTPSPSPPTAYLDVSTNADHNTVTTAYQMLTVNVGDPGNNYASVSWTGYLPSNDNYYYKIKLASLTVNTTGSPGGRIHIVLLSEAPTAAYVPF
jgi:hypothetical protein